MNEQLDFWGIDADEDPEAPGDPDEWSVTVGPALASYLHPWFMALKNSETYSRESKCRRFTTQALYDTYCLFGLIAGHKFEYWWQRHGHKRIGWSHRIQDVELPHKRRQGQSASPVVKIVIDGDRAEIIERMTIVITLLSRMREGTLSSCPAAWPWFHCSTSAQRMCRYLEVYRAVEAQGRGEKSRFLQTGMAMNLCPKSQIHGGDSRSEIQSKRDSIVKTTYAYWRSGKELVDGANQGEFPPKRMSSLALHK